MSTTSGVVVSVHLLVALTRLSALAPFRLLRLIAAFVLCAVLINLLPDFLAVLDAADREAAYRQYRDIPPTDPRRLLAQLRARPRQSPRRRDRLRRAAGRPQ